ncbi:phosphatidate cytidylyltransferase [Acutalibacter sp. 1XD8-36]|uniref:phosphatidate cytidylyltransferase n=1 Tax=Acutalibacter sp. 1XD8-36 TaxID=2320852 RepID=UPI0014133EC7|nr:phosphatidate cytidylyltransferase [Acutalibacter sp. 1XD8-36]NBJ88224.1 phosphatidate cytidylyltransferase [Acutalibacter sp. 1XD8-36]
MVQRVLSGIVLAVFMIAVIVFDKIFPLALNIAVAVISVMAVHELAAALGLQNKWFLCLPSLAAAAIVPFCNEQFQFMTYCVYTLIIFSALIVCHRETTFKEVAVLYSMVVIIPCALHTLVSLRELNLSHGMFYVLIAVLAAWVADVGAYFAGTLFGRHKLCPEISPKKTVEGLVGGTVVDMVVMLLCGVWFSAVFYQGQVGVNYIALLLIGLFGSLISVLGDLSFSIIKRSCHIKDFGQVIPGHGGVLDRFDSVIFTAPYVYLLVMFLPLAGV